MKKFILSSAVVAFVMVGAVSCKDNSKEIEPELQAASEASDMAVEYKIDTDESVVKWEGSKPTATHHGTVELSSGIFLVNNGNIEAGTFVIDMNTITDEDLEGEYKTNLENHLKGTTEGKEGDFFDVKKYPEAKFVLTSIEGNTVKGNLTIKEKTNPVEFQASIINEDDKIKLTSEPIELDRTKWDINFGSKSVFPNLGDKFISDTMTITLSLIANKI